MVFDDDVRWERLERELMSWLGTPYRHFARVKGRGADCILFIAESFSAAGILRSFTVDYYPRDWWFHSRSDGIRDMFVDVFEKHLAEGLRIESVQDGSPERGDIVTFAYPRTGVTCHGSVYLGDDTIIQAHFQNGVSMSFLSDITEYPVSGVYRIVRDL
jgi:cell wall-associated NlpC family hydrolase